MTDTNDCKNVLVRFGIDVMVADMAGGIAASHGGIHA
jgi:hypothetical protein